MRVVVPFLLFDIFIQRLVDIQRSVRYFLIKLRHIFESQTLDKAHHCRFIIFQFAVLELSFQRLFSESVLACHHFFECLPYLGACFRGRHDVQPVLFWCLGVRCHDFHLVAAVKLLFQLYIFAVHFGADAFASQLTVNMKCKIEYSSSFGKFE